MIAVPFVPVTDLRLLDESDAPWIDDLLDIVERSAGQPWRVALERIEHAPLASASRPVPRTARQQVVGALKRMLGGRAERGRIARRLRASVLGHPALDRDARDARIAIAAVRLGIEPGDVESLLWADIARERPVVLPGGRPAPRALAALANVDRLQRELRRAREIELVVHDNPIALVRMAARCGLIAAVARDPDGGFVLHLTGPLSLFHATTVYGRALGALVPLLADHTRWELAIHCDFASGPRTLRVAPPILLPPYEPRIRPSLAERLAGELERAEHRVERDPEPIVTGDYVLCPDLAIEHRGARWLVELVGFSTADYLAAKLARYAAAGHDVILCVDTKRSKLAAPRPRVLGFQRRVTVDALVATLEAAR